MNSVFFWLSDSRDDVDAGDSEAGLKCTRTNPNLISSVLMLILKSCALHTSSVSKLVLSLSARTESGRGG